MSKPIIPVEVFPLGHFLREELAARGQTVAELCNRTQLSPLRMQALLDDEETHLDFFECEWLGSALGCGATVLLNLQAAWFKWRQEKQS